MGLTVSSNKETKPHKEDITFCVICYENEIETLTLDCGHYFCNDCILSIHEYEDCPRCPLCRQHICVQTDVPLLKDDDSKWSKIGRKSVCCAIKLLAGAASSCLFCYNFLPMMREYFRDWDLTAIHEALQEFRLECSRVKDVWF